MEPCSAAIRGFTRDQRRGGSCGSGKSRAIFLSRHLSSFEGGIGFQRGSAERLRAARDPTTADNHTFNTFSP